MAVPTDLNSISTTASSNSPAGTDAIAATADDYLRGIQACLRQAVFKGADIASATSTDLSATVGSYHDITGTTTITNFGSTGTAGIVKILQFDGALTLTHGANIILPGAANITTAAGDVAMFVCEGSNVWRCVSYVGKKAYTGALTATSVLSASNDGGAIGASGTAFSDLFLAAGGVINWNAGAATITESSGQIQFGGTNGTQLVIEDTASAVNYLQVTGNATASPPAIKSIGSDTNISFNLISKGTGAFNFYSNNGAQQQFQITHTASAVNYIAVTGRATSTPPYFYCQGSDTNIGMLFFTKGTGSYQFLTNYGAGVEQFRITHTASAVNYWQFTGAATLGPITCTAAGSDTNIGFAFDTKGTGNFHITSPGFNNQGSLKVENTNATNAEGIYVHFSAVSTDNNSVWFFIAADSTTTRAVCYSDGDFANHDGTYGTLSDPSVKTSMTPAKSQWEDVKSLSKSMINYGTKFSKGKKLLGVNAEVVEAISPGLVHKAKWGDEELKIVDTMTMLQKGFKALGEVMERIERLESRYARAD